MGTATETDRVKNVTTGPKVVSTHLKFVDVWKKSTDGKWYIYRDSSVVDMPPELQNLIKNCVQAKQGAKKTSRFRFLLSPGTHTANVGNGRCLRTSQVAPLNSSIGGVALQRTDTNSCGAEFLCGWWRYS